MYSQVTMGTDDDSLRLQLEADIHHANALAAAIPRAKSGTRVQMKLVYNQLAPLFLFFLQWIHCSCTFFLPTYLNFFHVIVYKVYADGRTKNISTRGRKATITQFYAVILPSLEKLHHDNNGGDLLHVMKKERIKEIKEEEDREDECGICLEPCTRMVLPNCCHSMCINCYRDWNTRSESCPFCRGNIKRIMSTDLWVLTCSGEIIDADMVTKEDLSRFYLYMNKLPKVSPDDALFSMYYEYLI